MKRLMVTLLIAAIALAVAPANADSRRKTDGQDETKSLLDIKSVKHSHDGNKLVHKVTTYGSWKSSDLKDRSIYISIDLPDSGGLSNFFYIFVAYKNGDLRAKLYNNSGDPPRFVTNVTVGRPNNKSVRVKFTKNDFEEGDFSRYEWGVATNDQRSSGCNNGCYDNAPNSGFITHKNL